MEQRETSFNRDTHHRQKEAEPPKYDVFVLNDDFTELGFVIDVLVKVFFLAREMASSAAWETHRKGRSKIGTYQYDIAMSKIRKAVDMARAKGYPLRFEAVPEK